MAVRYGFSATWDSSSVHFGFQTALRSVDAPTHSRPPQTRHTGRSTPKSRVSRWCACVYGQSAEIRGGGGGGFISRGWVMILVTRKLRFIMGSGGPPPHTRNSICANKITSSRLLIICCTSTPSTNPSIIIHHHRVVSYTPISRSFALVASEDVCASRNADVLSWA